MQVRPDHYGQLKQRYAQSFNSYVHLKQNLHVFLTKWKHLKDLCMPHFKRLAIVFREGAFLFIKAI